MNCLLIDTSTSYLNICILDYSNKKLLYKFNEMVKSDMSSKIVPIIDEGLKSNNLSLSDINKIFVVNGPGSFTGIRVGVTVAKTIAWALKIDIIPISSLALMASINTDKKYIVPLIDARRNNVFGAIYDENLNSILSDRLINIDELLNNVDNDSLFVSYDNISLENIVKPDIDIFKLINKYINEEPINPHNLNPNYLKLTEAEENKNKND